MGHLALDLHARGQGALYAPPHSKERFATWLRSRYVTAADAVAADGAPRCGLLSMRLYTQAANLSAAGRQSARLRRDRASIVGRNVCPCPLARCAGASSAPVHAACHKALNSAPLPPFDCWLHTETLDTDFAACMRKYQERGGEVKNTDALCARNVQGNSSDAEKRCEAMHSPATAALLRHVDGGVYRRFGYTKCCGGRPAAPPAAPLPLCKTAKAEASASAASTSGRGREAPPYRLPRAPAVAFSMAGEARSFLDPAVHESILANAVHPLGGNNSRVFAYLKVGVYFHAEGQRVAALQCSERKAAAPPARISEGALARQLAAAMAKLPMGGWELVNDTTADEDAFLGASRATGCGRRRRLQHDHGEAQIRPSVVEGGQASERRSAGPEHRAAEARAEGGGPAHRDPARLAPSCRVRGAPAHALRFRRPLSPRRLLS